MVFIISRWDNGQSNARPAKTTVLTGIFSRKIAARAISGSRQHDSEESYDDFDEISAAYIMSSRISVHVCFFLGFVPNSVYFKSQAKTRSGASTSFMINVSLEAPSNIASPSTLAGNERVPET